MLKSIGIGTELFHKLIEKNYYYVDKTPFIKTIFEDNDVDVMLITRPRRFGKTLTMSTFYDFLSLDPENPGDTSRQEKWFKDTDILKEDKYKDFRNKYMGKFPVVFISLKQVDGDDFISAYGRLATVVYEMYSQFRYLADSNKLYDDEISSIRKYLDEEYLQDINNNNAIKNSLTRLLKYLNKHHGIKPILLIDEYDVPIAKAASKNYYKEMIDVISPFLGNALKTNLDLDRAVLTGCLRAAKESIFTGLNNFLVYSVLSTGEEDMSKGIGFTKEEAEKVLTCYGLKDYHETAQNNYDGYYFGYVHMFCPWDVMSFCKENYEKVGRDGYYFGYVHMFCPWDVMSFCKENYEKVGRENEKITAGNYWINTSGNDAIEEFMGFIGPKDIKKMQSLMDGESIEVEVREALCYGDLKKHDMNDFWTLLLYTGYLTFDPQYIGEEEDLCSVYIPNEEIRKCFKSKILNFYKKNTVMKNRTDDLIKGLFTGDAELIETSLCSLLAKYVSIRDFSTRAPKENYYHGFMNGLLVNGASLIQEQKSNFESGNGYVDLIIKSQKNSESKGIIAIIELKQTSDENDDKVLIADSAIEQIINKKYADAYIKRNDIREVYIYGICFYAKECSVVVKKLK